MLALILAVSCSLAIGMIFKHGGRQEMDRMSLLTVNYLVAFVLAVILVELGGREISGGLAIEPALLALGLATGALFIFGFFMLSLATDVAGMSLAVGVMRVSVVIPFLASWVIWAEVPTVAQGAGLVLASGAFFMISHKTKSAAKRAPAAVAGTLPMDDTASGQVVSRPQLRVFIVLAVLFLAGGMVDVSMKTFDEVFAAQYSRALFMLMVFGVAFLIGAVYITARGLAKSTWPRMNTCIWGAILGLVNYGSVEFILRAIDQLSGPFVFPANSISIVIGGALLGVYFWGEQLSRLNWMGLGVAALALLLLNL